MKFFFLIFFITFFGNILSAGETADSDAAQVAEMPKTANQYNNAGVLLTQEGKYDEATELFQKAIMLNERYTKAWFNLGTAYFNSEKYSWAIPAFESAANYSDEKNNYKDKSYYYLAKIYMKQNNNKKAREYANMSNLPEARELLKSIAFFSEEEYAEYKRLKENAGKEEKNLKSAKESDLTIETQKKDDSLKKDENLPQIQNKTENNIKKIPKPPLSTSRIVVESVAGTAVWLLGLLLVIEGFGEKDTCESNLMKDNSEDSELFECKRDNNYLLVLAGLGVMFFGTPTAIKIVGTTENETGSYWAAFGGNAIAPVAGGVVLFNLTRKYKKPPVEASITPPKIYTRINYDLKKKDTVVEFFKLSLKF